MQMRFFRLRTHQCCFLLFNALLFHALLFGADFVEEYLLQSSPNTYTDAQTRDIRERARKLTVGHLKNNASRFFCLSNSGVCGHNNIFLLSIISSDAENSSRRDMIRKTWANVTQVRGYSVLTLFALGTPRLPDTQREINREFAKHGDMIQGKFLDGPENLTLKTIMIMQWVVTFCPKALFILKSDEKSFVNYVSLMGYLLGMRSHAEDLYIGRVQHQDMPNRDPLNANFVPVSQYAGQRYPDYCSATAFVISQDVARKIYVVSAELGTSLPEAVFVGICAKRAGVVPTHSSRFSGNKHIRFNRCCYQFLFSSYGLSDEELGAVWEEISDGSNCSMLETYSGLIKCKALTYLDKLI